MADPHLAAHHTDLLHKLVSASNRLLCDARRVRDGAFPAKGPNLPDDYHRQMACSVYPSGYVMSVAEYNKMQKEKAERSETTAPSTPSTNKRTVDMAGDGASAPSTKRPAIIASVRPPTPYPAQDEALATPRGQQPDTGSAPSTSACSTDRHEKVILCLNTRK